MARKALCLVVTVLELAAVCVRADYQVEVRFFSYQNPSHRKSDGSCCDGEGTCGDQLSDFCDNLFKICLNEEQLQMPCQSPSFLVTQNMSDVVSNDDDLVFENGPGAFLGLPNPLVFNASGQWPNEEVRELGIVVFDISGVMNVSFIGDFIINISTLSPGNSTGAVQYDSRSPPGGLHLNLSITVQCAENFYGVDCSRVCVYTDSELGHYTCDSQGFIACSEGYRNTSTNCTECMPADGCFPSHCPTAEVGGYCEGPGDCICLPGYTGALCDIDLDQCGSTMPCQNGGTCVNSGDGGFNCTCREGFEGERCQSVRTDVCDPDPCQNGGTCVNSGDGGFNCTCREEFEGERCQSVKTDECDSDPCQNGATCVDLLGDYMCTCKTGFTGRNCSDTEMEDGSQSDSSGVSTAVLAGGVGGMAVLLLIIMILTIALVVLWRQTRSSPKLNLQADQDMDPKANEAYGTESAIPLTENEIYETIPCNDCPGDDEGYVINQLTYDHPHTETVATAPNMAYGGLQRSTAKQTTIYSTPTSLAVNAPAQYNGSPEGDEGYVINQLTYNHPHTETVATAPNVAYGGVQGSTGKWTTTPTSLAVNAPMQYDGCPEDDEGYVISQPIYNHPHTEAAPTIATEVIGANCEIEDSDSAEYI